MTADELSTRDLARGTTTALLATKLLSPPTRAGLLARPRLVDRLRQAQRGPLTLLAAPAGSGKTTAISAWLAAAGAHAAWLAVDAEDNDPLRFWTYVCAACDRLVPGCGAAALALLQAPQPAPLPIVVATLINSLAVLPVGGGPERPYVLILDDYHAIETASIHETLALLIERLPPQLHLAITARADPPLPLARLRARGLLTELRTADLRFNSDEARALIRDVAGLRLGDAAIAALEERTEGWVAGLQLAALALHDQPDPEAFVAGFAGTHAYIVDYLADEVLAQQPAHIRTFLLRTALLEQLCGPLCDAVLGLTNDRRPTAKDRAALDSSLVVGRSSLVDSYSQLILAELARKNLFLIPLDGERRWYRYHHLFADVLRARLRESAPEVEPELHRRASAWYAGEIATAGAAYLDLAARHAIAGGDVDLAARLIEQEAEGLLRHGSFAQLIQLVRALPQATVRRSPSLSLIQARALFGAAEPAAVPPLLDSIAASLAASPLAEPKRQRIRAWAVALDSQLLRVRGDYPAAIARAHEALALLPEDEPAARGFVTMGLALALHMSGRLREAVAPYLSAIRLLDADDRHTAMTTRCLLGLLYRSLGRWDAAAEIYWQALEEANQQVLGATLRLPTAGWAMIGLGELAYGRNDLAEAATQLEAGVALAEQGRVRDALPFGYAALALLRQAQGLSEEARAASERFLRFAARDFNLPLVAGWAGALAARVALTQGDRVSAERWARGYEPPSGALFLSQAFEFTTFLRVLIAAERAEAAVAHAAEQLQRAEAGGDLLLALELHMLQARAHAVLRQPEPARAALARALNLAGPIGADRIFLDEGTALAALLAESLKRTAQNDPIRNHAEQLLAAFPQTASDERGAAKREDTMQRPSSVAPPLAEPLTPREREILQRIAVGQSNQEIADALVVSVGTVKTHVHHLYGKLAARDRTHAVARARALGLLD